MFLKHKNLIVTDFWLLPLTIMASVFFPVTCQGSPVCIGQSTMLQTCRLWVRNCHITVFVGLVSPGDPSPPSHISQMKVNNLSHIKQSGFPRILENLGNNKLIFQVLEMSLNFAKSGNVMENILPVKNPLRTEKTVNKYYVWRGNLRLYKKKCTSTQS